MKIEVDTHVHTVISDHAHSTITEVIASAAEYGLKGIVETEHGPLVPGGPPYFFFHVTPMPKERAGVRLYFGCEANIMCSTGDLDIYTEHLRNLDFVNAALHQPVMPPSHEEYHTRALINAIKNPLVDCIAHPENPAFQIDMDIVVKAAAKYGKLLEINNNSFLVRPGGKRTFEHMLRACMNEGVRITVASDAHIDSEVGRVEQAMEVIEDVCFPKDMIVNATVESFENYLAERRERIEEYIARKEIIFEGCSF
ncbi:MAG: PHP domain-containing protein [Bacillota bacterium]